MKKPLLLIALAISCFQFAFSQSASRIPADLVKDAKRTALPFQKTTIFSLDSKTSRTAAQIDAAVEAYNLVDVDLSQLQRLGKEAPRTISLEIPVNFVDKFELELVKVNLFTPDFQVIEASDRSAKKVNTGVHYRGIINGMENSIAAISIFDGEVMGLVSSSFGNIVIGRLQAEKQDTKHIIYKDDTVLQELGFECQTEDDGVGYTNKELTYQGSNAKAVGDCIRYYMEVDHDIYLDKGSTEDATAYVAGIMNEVATIYANEGLQTVVSEVFVWNVPSPYSSGSSGGMLDQFQANTSAINGDLGQLLSYQASGGVAAGFSGICNDEIDNSLSFSSINSSFATVPTYSYTVMVVAHEFGHLWGSRHTHACVWNGNSTAIDGCSGNTEGDCDLPGFPAEGGTIMSYCHLQAVGINFTRGFGPQPGNVIRNSVANASCTVSCGPSSCDDGFLNGQETGIDCGGPDCIACPTCDDGIQNGEETGVDCGGPDCIVCPTCNDGIKNGDEEGIDCGGSDCISCNGCFDQLDYNDFNTDMGIWIDGGSDCRRGDAQYAVGGVGAAVRLRDNSSSSIMTTTNLNLAGFTRVAIKFSYITASMDSPNHDFWLQISTDGGSTFTTVEEWNLGDEFENDIRYFETVEISAAFSANTQIRFRCDAGNDSDYVYLDNVRITACDGEPVEPTCTDGIQNGQETGVDCGGPDCPSCPTEPTCDDGIQNGQETGVDCGGPDCPSCPTEPTCDDGIQNGQETGVDCGGPDCPSCPTEPTCDDGIQNGQETGVDCGGPDCPACPVEPTCSDGIQNGNETGIDCGGPDCVPCSTECTVQEVDFNDFNTGWGIWNDGGSDCTRSSSDAQYSVGGVGAPVRLRDNSSSSHMTTDNLALLTYQELTVNFSYITVSMDNANEDFFLEVSTDGGSTFTVVEEWNLGDEFENDVRYFDAVTIAGPFSNSTQLRFRCDASTNSDLVYIDDVRITGCNSGGSEPTCTDGIQNGQETGVDCGGPDCPTCPTEPTCTDGIQNGQETGVDCGGPDCPSCPTEPTCTDGIQNGQETGVDCGGPDCPTCPTEPTCDDGIQNGQEQGVDCGGPDCAPCSGECTTQLIDFNDFNTSFGIWNDGGSDCTRSSAYAQYAVGGTGSAVRLRDNSSSSNMTTDNLNLSAYQDLTVDFSYITVSMDNPDEDFFLEISTDGGNTFTIVEEWNLGDEFENEVRYFDAVSIPGPFSANTQLRFRCDASTNSDQVYLDDISISGCSFGAALASPVDIKAPKEALESVGTQQLALFPNPVRSELLVSFDLTVENDVTIAVTNLQGKVMGQQLLDGARGKNRTQLDVSRYPAGIYVLKLSTKTGSITEKFVVVK